MRHKVELLAPAGSYDSLKAAIGAGADAVYLGRELLQQISERMNCARLSAMPIFTAVIFI